MTGEWQVYAKIDDYWLPLGPTRRRAEAEAEVATLWQRIRAGDEPRMTEPHAVPV